jgi:hypothetical protein
VDLAVIQFWEVALAELLAIRHLELLAEPMVVADQAEKQMAAQSRAALAVLAL